MAHNNSLSRPTTAPLLSSLCGSGRLSSTVSAKEDEVSLIKVFYGVEDPSQTRKIVIHTIFLTMALAFYGGWMDFIPSRDWSSAGVGIAGILSIIATVLFAFS